MLFETLADPTRRRIVEEFSGGERTVSELVEAVTIRQSGVSRHLRILHDAGFVSVRPEGQRRLYSLAQSLSASSTTGSRAIGRSGSPTFDRLGAELERRKSTDHECRETTT